MRIIVNGKPLEVEEDISLLALLEKNRIEVRPVGLAVAVNEEIVPKSRYAEYKLKEGDRVEIVNIVGGG
ncbi:sulfur carrier protein ThiS [Hydrogenobacter sp. T-2]|uniref:sulfur carrier protein ThiS n=1 Tax=Pampinifervens diazotrophicum TaxID=1632018 RepID=UPI002B25795C|nr:sulfur carrier protein ThiS [Hydrogenobacter sp. T-2]WPM32553.1 sulfur carrier protein ThiS [Hydrogenobacter sp. T-2]